MCWLVAVGTWKNKDQLGTTRLCGSLSFVNDFISHLNSSLHAAGLFDRLLIAGWVLTLWNMVHEGRLLQDIGWLARRRTLEDRNSIVNIFWLTSKTMMPSDMNT